MLAVSICDDDKDTVTRCVGLVESYSQKHNIEVAVSVYESGEQLLFDMLDDPNDTDVIIMDVIMEGKDGIQTASELRKMGSAASIIFLSNSREFVFDSFAVTPVDYLLKNALNPTVFDNVLLRCYHRHQMRNHEYWIYETRNSKKLIPIKEIAYFEIWKRVVVAHQAHQQPEEFYGVMEIMEEKLKPLGFIRVHRSFLVNLNYIIRFEARQLRLSTGEIIPIGTTYRQNAHEAFSQYLTRYRVFRGDHD